MDFTSHQSTLDRIRSGHTKLKVPQAWSQALIGTVVNGSASNILHGVCCEPYIKDGRFIDPVNGLSFRVASNLAHSVQY